MTARSWAGRDKYGALDQTLTHHQKSVQRVVKPDNKFWELQEYIEEHGDSLTNGELWPR